LSFAYGLRSTGLLVFAGRIISAFTGLLFTVMVARWLDPASFGTWEVIVTLVTFSAYPIGVVAFWTTRDVARGKMVGRTALASGALLSGLGLMLYFGFTFFTYQRISAQVLPFLLGGLLVPLSYWSAVANSIVSGFRPGVYGYSLVLSEVAKLGVAYETLFVYRLGIEGVIIALMASYFVQSVASTYFVRVTFSERFDLAQTRKWSKLAWLPGVIYLATALGVADTYVAAIFFGSAIVGYYQVAFLVAGVVGYSSALAVSLYPMLLRGGNERLPAITMEFALLFSIPMAAGSIALAGPILYLFGSRWTLGAEGLAVLAVSSLFGMVSGIVDQVLLGSEKADAAEKPRFWDLLRSNLTFVPVANILYAIFYVISLYFILSYGFARAFPTSTLVAAWGSAQLLATILFVGVKARRASRYAKLMPGRSVAYFVAAASVMAVVAYAVTGVVTNQTMGALSYGLRLLGVGLLAAAIYFGLVYAMDSGFRDLARSLAGRLRQW
jgi:O-antigen/teichoic acid export membrane protein